MACQDFNIIFGLSFTRNIHSEIADKPAIYKQYSESRQYVPAESKDNFNMSKGKFNLRVWVPLVLLFKVGQLIC